MILALPGCASRYERVYCVYVSGWGHGWLAGVSLVLSFGGGVLRTVLDSFLLVSYAGACVFPTCER